MDNFILEKKIKETLEKQSEHVPMDFLTDGRMKKQVFEEIEEAQTMKHGNWKRTVIAAAAICVLGSMTALGLGRATVMVGHSSNQNEIHSYEEARTAQANYNGNFAFPEKFSNGYQFKAAVPVHNEMQDDEGNVLGTETSLNVTYGNDGKEDVMLSAEEQVLEDSKDREPSLTLEDGTELYYSELNNKFVPPDYEATEEELKQQEEGTLNLAYGNDTVEVISSHMVSWSRNGLHYVLFQFGNDLSQEEFLTMAQEAAEFQ